MAPDSSPRPDPKCKGPQDQCFGPFLPSDPPRPPIPGLIATGVSFARSARRAHFWPSRRRTGRAGRPRLPPLGSNRRGSVRPPRAKTNSNSPGPPPGTWVFFDNRPWGTTFRRRKKRRVVFPPHHQVRGNSTTSASGSSRTRGGPPALTGGAPGKPPTRTAVERRTTDTLNSPPFRSWPISPKAVGAFPRPGPPPVPVRRPAGSRDR